MDKELNKICLRIMNHYTSTWYRQKSYYKRHPAIYKEHLQDLQKQHIHFLKLKIKYQQYRWKHANKHFKKRSKNRYTYNQSINHLTYKIKVIKAGGIRRVRAIGADGSISTVSLLPQSFDTENHLQHSIHKHMQKATLNTKGIVAIKLHFSLSKKQIKNIHDILATNKFSHDYQSKIDLLNYYCNFNLDITNKKINKFVLTIPIFANHIKYFGAINSDIKKLLKHRTMLGFLQWYFIDDKYHSLSILPKKHL